MQSRKLPELQCRQVLYHTKSERTAWVHAPFMHRNPVIDMNSPAHAQDKAAQSLHQKSVSSLQHYDGGIHAQTQVCARHGQGFTFIGSATCLCCPSRRELCIMVGAATQFIVTGVILVTFLKS